MSMMHYPQCQSIDMLPVAEEKLRETLDVTLRQISHLDKHYQNNTLLKTSLCHELIERWVSLHMRTECYLSWKQS